MGDAVLFSMNANDRCQYLARREAEIVTSNPHLYLALRIEELKFDQKTALFQALEILAIPRQLSRAAVMNAVDDVVPLADEAKYVDNVRWTQVVSPIACGVGGVIERRNAVRLRLCLAIRAARLAESQ